MEARNKNAFSKLSIYSLIGPKLVATMALLVYTGLTILLSLYDSELNFVGAQWEVILYKVGITDGLLILSMQVGQIFYESAMKRNPLSEWSKSRIAYDCAYSDIRPIKDYFPQFFTEYKQSQLRIKKIDWVMSMNHFDSVDKVRKLVMNCRMDELDALLDHPIKRPINPEDPSKEVLLPRLSQEQHDDIKKVLQGCVKLDHVQNFQYYLSLDAKKGTSSILEESYGLDVERKRSLIISEISYISAYTLMNVFIALITIKEYYGGDSSAWINLISRISAICSGIWCGFMIKGGDMSYASMIINRKTDVLIDYHNSSDNGTFKPITDEEEQERSWNSFVERKRAEDEREQQALEEERESQRKAKEAKDRYMDFIEAGALEKDKDGNDILPSSKKAESIAKNSTINISDLLK